MYNFAQILKAMSMNDELKNVCPGMVRLPCPYLY